MTRMKQRVFLSVSSAEIAVQICGIDVPISETA
jgi:hypothetical protein